MVLVRASGVSTVECMFRTDVMPWASRSGKCHPAFVAEWTWASHSPGITYEPAASTTSAASGLGRSADGSTATIRPSVTSTVRSGCTSPVMTSTTSA